MMKIGLLCNEYFGKINKDRPTNSHGGFGFLIRKKAEEYAKRGYEVHVFTPRYAYDGNNIIGKDLELNKVNIHLFPTIKNDYSNSRFIRFVGTKLDNMIGPTIFSTFIRKYDIDIFQIEDPFLPVMPIIVGLKHITISQDPFDDIDNKVMKYAWQDYLYGDINNPKFVTEVELRKKLPKQRIYSIGNSSINLLLKRAVQKESLTTIYSEAKFIAKKSKAIYDLNFEPNTLLNPVDIKNFGKVYKSEVPSIVFLGRWDAQKRPDIALKIAKEMPQFDFYFIGSASGLKEYLIRQKQLRKLYKKYKNIHILDFINEKEKQLLLQKSWLLLNTSVREGLPISFLEAGANKMAIVSSVDPDEYTSKFGIFVEDGKIENFKNSINYLIKTEECFELGKLAYKYMLKHHETKVVIKKHLDILSKIYKQDV
jgi:glycosyltransferase involved in cell wall biosynthesis